MYRKIVYIIIACLSFHCATAQQDKVMQLLNRIRAAMEPVLNDSTVVQGCKTTIQALKFQLPAATAKTITLQKAQSLTATGTTFINSLTGTERKACAQDARIDSLAATTKQLISALAVLKSSIAAGTDSLVRISLQPIDSITGKNLAANLVIDSAGKPLKRLLLKEDSALHFDVLLVLNKTYTITTTADGYRTARNVFVVKKNSGALVINLAKIAAAAAMPGSGSQRAGTATATLQGVKPAEILTPAQPGLLQQYIDENPATFNIAVIIAALLAIIALLYFVTVFKSISKTKGFSLRSVVNPSAVFEKELRHKDMAMQGMDRNLQIAASSLAQLSKKQQATISSENVLPVIAGGALAATPVLQEQDQLPEIVEEKLVTPATTPATTGTADPYFLCEIMMTAGPRKKFMDKPDADKDLGEDACGFVATSDEVLIWLLDGTSDVHCLRNPETGKEYFSSRLLAQCIADKLRKSFGEKDTATLDDTMKTAIRSVRTDWLKTIAELPAEEHQRLRANLEDGNFPDCSTTLLVAKLQLNGAFTGYRSGDSKLLLFTSTPEKEFHIVDTPLAAKGPESFDRAFFRIGLDDLDNIDIWYNEPKFELERKNDISTVIAFSDGIGSVTEQALSTAFKNAPDKTRHEIITQAQGTADDKSICFLEIKQSNKPAETQVS